MCRNGETGSGQRAEQAAYVRDSRNPLLGHLSFPSGEWAAFLGEVASGRS
ncbi:DUF397 domain-containing protein [Nocardiopsis baichengensis]|nr:DUF397 domain-containing protein [Nocardiopsis baichengensis]